MGELVLTQLDLLFTLKEELVEDMIVSDGIGCGKHEISASHPGSKKQD